MKNIILLEKSIFLDNIKDLINISVDEQVSYLRKCEGVTCNGEIIINGVYENTNGIEKLFNEHINIDNTIPYENISSLEDFSVVVDDFEYSLTDEKLNMFIKLKINSFKDIEVSFPAEDEEQVVIEDKVEEREVVVEETKPFLSLLLDDKKYTKSSTFFVYKKDTNLEQICQKYNISMEILKKHNKENLQEGDLINIPLSYE